jgi:glutaminase
MNAEPLTRKDVYERLATLNHGLVNKQLLHDTLMHAGIQAPDPRVLALEATFSHYTSDAPIPFEEFKPLIQEHRGLLERVIRGDLVIPDFQGFCSQIKEIFEESEHKHEGQVATYIPQLARVNPDQFGMAICTIDGQTFTLGDATTPFCAQSVCKPVNYALALEEHGEKYVHKYVGREPSGHHFNHLSLNKNGLPHNPLLNSGAISICGMLHQSLSPSERLDKVLSEWKGLTGGRYVGFNNAVYLSEKETADRNFAIGYFLRENKALPEGADLIETLEFYFQCCSIELTCESMAVAAASLANAGVCPLTAEKILKPKVVKNCLSLMSSCGMYDFSGEFAFSVGLPGKSGVSGALMLVIPNVMGIALWSPRLDSTGNSVRGIDFCKRLVKRFNFHRYENLIHHGKKLDPRRDKNASNCHQTAALCWAAFEGDNQEIGRLIANDVNVNATDYDQRTPLHIAAAEGHLSTVKFLLSLGANKNARDRWDHTPFDDATGAGHETVAKVLI